MRNTVKLRKILVQLSVCVAFVLTGTYGCHELLTEAPEANTTLEEPFEGLSFSELAAFSRGDAAFEDEFTPAIGLGPVFNNTACGSCHPGDGRAHKRDLFKLFGRVDADTIDLLRTLGGPQLQDRSISGVKPEEIPPEANAVSERAAPPVFGVGLIEFIPKDSILAHAILKADNVHGRPNIVTAPSYIPDELIRDNIVVPGDPDSLLGRFGLKANTSNILEQVARAYHQDIGITTDFIPEENYPAFSSEPADLVPDPELPASVVQDVIFYIRFLAPPKRGEITTEVTRGESLFESYGCALCHVPTLRTGPSPFAALAFKDVDLYSDLLLHDMGDDLADDFIDGQASGSEWRTKPLWGLGRTADALGGTPFYLHDGRTSDLLTAILLHGGEAQASRERVAAASTADKQALLAFLNSL